MYCTRCGTPIQTDANFCMRCGAPIAKQEAKAAAAAPAPAPAAAAAGPIMIQAQPSAANRALPFVALIAIIVLILLGGLMASGALTKTGRANSGSLAMQGSTPAPALAAPANAPLSMPPDVHDWLEHLRRIEERKNQLNSQQLAQLKVFGSSMEALGPAAGLLNDNGDDEAATNPTAPMKQETTDLAAPWKKLVKDFQAVPPPPECQRLADEYFAGLNEIPAMMGDIQNLLNSLSGDSGSSAGDSGSGAPSSQSAQDALQKANSMEGTSGSSIDTHFQTSDDLLGGICQRYNTPKWFNITPDVGGGVLGKTPF